MSDNEELISQDKRINRIFSWLLTEISCSRQEIESHRNWSRFWLGITVTAILAAITLNGVARIGASVLALYSFIMFYENIVRETRANKIIIQLHEYLRDPVFDVFKKDEKENELPQKIYSDSIKHILLVNSAIKEDSGKLKDALKRRSQAKPPVK